MAKVKNRKGMNPDSRLMTNIEMELMKREEATTLLAPNFVVNVPPIKEKSRYPRRIAPLRSPI
jgi:hypothetical protein